MIDYILAAIVGYLLGSIPFGLLITRAAGLGDVRKIGSGNIGATNVLRTGRRELAALTLLLDAAKGVAAVLVAAAFLGRRCGLHRGDLRLSWAIASRSGCGFKGGKGVATFIGVLLALAWPVGVIFCVVWLVIAFAQKYSSLAALTAAVTSPIFAYAAWLWGFPTDGGKLAATAGLIALLLVFNHRGNIGRLMNGTEPKIGSDKKTGGSCVMARATGTLLSPSQKIAWLRLIRTDNVGPVTFRQLLNRTGSAEAALAELPRLAGRVGVGARIPSRRRGRGRDRGARKARRPARRLGRAGLSAAAALHFGGPAAADRSCGGERLDLERTVAIVGARNASAAGQRMTSILAIDLGERGYTVVSGLARGIDAAAHRASLRSGTVAVLAGGLDQIYPDENIPLARSHRRTGRHAADRNADGLGAARAGFSAAQPAGLGPVAGRGRGRSGASARAR